MDEKHYIYKKLSVVIGPLWGAVSYPSQSWRHLPTIVGYLNILYSNSEQIQTVSLNIIAWVKRLQSKQLYLKRAQNYSTKLICTADSEAIQAEDNYKAGDELIKKCEERKTNLPSEGVSVVISDQLFDEIYSERLVEFNLENEIQERPKIQSLLLSHQGTYPNYKWMFTPKYNMLPSMWTLVCKEANSISLLGLRCIWWWFWIDVISRMGLRRNM